MATTADKVAKNAQGTIKCEVTDTDNAPTISFKDKDGNAVSSGSGITVNLGSWGMLHVVFSSFLHFFNITLCFSLFTSSQYFIARYNSFFLHFLMPDYFLDNSAKKQTASLVVTSVTADVTYSCVVKSAEYTNSEDQVVPIAIKMFGKSSLLRSKCLVSRPYCDQNVW